jgi:hypothetical protein
MEALIDCGNGGARTGAGRKKGGKNSTPSASGEFAAQKAVAILEMAEAKAKKESYLAHLAELEYKQKRAELIAIESVYRVLDSAVTACREHLMGIPGRYASILAAESDARTIETLLETEIRRALEQISEAKEHDYRTG